MSSYSDHHDFNVMLSAYLDGELTQAERTELLQHLATCQSCRDTLDEYRAIGTRLRSLPPVHSPDDLTDAIYAQTVDAPPRRLFLLTNRVGYPVAAVAAVLLVFVVAVFLLVDGYRRGIDPTIVGSSPPGQVMWSIHEPIQITFNKEMDRASVEAALIIQPTSERDQLDRHWEGNTLVIGGNRPLKPGSSYEVAVTTDARDRWGNRLTEPFSLSFATSSSVQASDSDPTPAPTPSATPTPEQEIAALPSRTATAIPASPTPESVERPADPVATSTSTPATTGENGSSGSSEEGTNGETQEPADPPPAVAPDPTATPVPPTPTPTPEPVPTEEPTEIPPTADPEPTVTVEPEPTEEPLTPTAEPEPSPTPDTFAVTGSFGSVYWGNESVQLRLGDPAAPEGPIGARELDFQHGKMFQNLDSGEIYLMETRGTWSSVLDTASDPLPEFVETSEEGIWEPGGVFGYIWHEESYVEETLGYAVEGETQEFQSLIQNFENGIMLASADGFIYVLYTTDLTWELYPDAGPLSESEPTPVP